MEPFKNKLGTDAVRRIASAIAQVWSPFPAQPFLREISKRLEPLELKARVQVITDGLCDHLPEKNPQTFRILVSSAPQLESFEAWPLTEVVPRRGLSAPELSLKTLSQLTPHFTGEFAIRPFLKMHLPETLRQMQQWTTHRNEHVRRLASEGCRPNLPWGGKLEAIYQNPQLTIPILDALHSDPSDTVRLSVANHLNDFSRTHPDLVLAKITEWKASGSKYFPALARRALRTLVKQGNPEAFSLLGIEQDAMISCRGFQLKHKQIPWGGAVNYSAELQNPGDQPLTVLQDIALHFLRANGSHSRKVFRSRKLELAAQETRVIHGAFSFKPITTRKYYAGHHQIELLLNGQPGAQLPFTLLAEI